VAQRVAALHRDLEAVPGTLAEIALRFCLSQGAVSTVIPGMRHVQNAESSCSVSDRGPLAEEVLKVLEHHVWDKNFYD
jgi:aryl-alcohol dehydrogenase-like predicted oxidoreductase